MMNNIPREQLKELIGEYGRSLSKDPKRCEALLRDVCGQYRKEISVLVSAIKESIPVDLSHSQHRETSNVLLVQLLAQLTKRLEDRLAIDREAARWGVESWAIALGLISEGAGNTVEPPRNPPPDPQPKAVYIPASSTLLTTQPVNNNPSSSNPSSVPPANHQTLLSPPPDGSVVIDPILPPNSNIRLFTQSQVGLATFFGGLLGGSILMTLNYNRLGQKSKAKQCLIIGLVPNIIMDFLMFRYSLDMAGQFCGIIILPSIFFMYIWYGRSQNTLFKQHLLNGGKKGSWWSALGATILASILIYPWFNLTIFVVTIIGGDKF
jgi:hypothetical protein